MRIGRLPTQRVVEPTGRCDGVSNYSTLTRRENIMTRREEVARDLLEVVDKLEEAYHDLGIVEHGAVNLGIQETNSSIVYPQLMIRIAIDSTTELVAQLERKL